MVYIHYGVAQGFQIFMEDAKVINKCRIHYIVFPGGVRGDDLVLGISWRIYSGHLVS